MKKPIRWGIIGCGSVTEIKSGPAYKNTADFEVVAVMRRTESKAADYAKRHKISTYYTNADDLILDHNVDAVYIATPPDTHSHYALKVADAKKPCCIEKPMATSYQDSLIIYTAFKEKNIPLFIAYYRRSLPRFLKIKEWLDKKAIGEVRHIQWCLTKPASDLDKSGVYNWRTDAKIAPGGYFDDLASHGLDLFSFLLGNIKNATGFATNQQGLYAAKDSISASWIHENGITGAGTWNFGSYQREDKVEIIGSKGKVVFSVFKETDIVLQTLQKTTALFIANPKHIQTYHVENIRNHLLDHTPHPSLGKSGLHCSWVMDKILGNLGPIN